MCDKLLLDPMHVLIEGVCRKELKVLLENLIYDKKCLTLTKLNYLIPNFDFMRHDRGDIPNAIDDNQKKNGSFNLSAGQMLVLFHNLPTILGFYINDDDNNWNNFIILFSL